MSLFIIITSKRSFINCHYTWCAVIGARAKRLGRYFDVKFSYESGNSYNCSDG